MRASLRAAAFAGALAVLVPTAASAQARSHWRERWPRFHPAEGVLTLVAAGVGVGIFVQGEQHAPRWIDALPGDRDFRSAVAWATRSDRETLSHVSDAMFVGMMVYPVAIDALLVAGAIRLDTDVMGQMLLIDAEALSLGLFAAMITTRVVGRERPYVEECARDPEYAAGCGESYLGRYTSFVGGHALMSFLGAGLICAHHVAHPWLYGSEGAGATACAAGLGIATAISFMRAAGDRHWMSDLVAGAVVGSTIGWLVPLLHYAVAPRARAPVPVTALPGAAGAEIGLTIAASF